MSVEKLRRVLWRLRSMRPGQDSFTRPELERAIMYECGTSPLTYRRNRLALVKLQWMRRKKNGWVRLTGKDLAES